MHKLLCTGKIFFACGIESIVWKLLIYYIMTDYYIKYSTSSSMSREHINLPQINNLYY